MPQSQSHSRCCCACCSTEDPLQELPYQRYAFFCIRQRPATLVMAFSKIVAYIWLLVKFIFHLRDVEPLDITNTTHWRIIHYPVQIFLMLMLIFATIRRAATILAIAIWLEFFILQIILALVSYWFIVIPTFALVIFVYYLASMYMMLCANSFYQELRGSYFLAMAPKEVKT